MRKLICFGKVVDWVWEIGEEVREGGWEKGKLELKMDGLIGSCLILIYNWFLSFYV